MSAWPTHPVILASGYAGGVAFRDRVLIRTPGGAYGDGELTVTEDSGTFTAAHPLELILADALADLDDSLDPWDLRLEVRSLPNAMVTRLLERVPATVAGAAAAGPGACIDSPANPWFEPTAPSDDRFIPIVRAGYYGTWRGHGFRIRLLPGDGEPAAQLIAYADPSARTHADFNVTGQADAPFTRTVAQGDLETLYTVEGRALVGRHLVTICGSRPGVTLVTAQDVPEHEQARQVAAAGRFMAQAGAAPGAAGPDVPDLGTDAAPPCSVAASRPLPETIAADNRSVTAVRMDRTDFTRTATGWQGDWRARRPPIYLRAIPQF